jgi:hypothetical protein
MDELPNSEADGSPLSEQFPNAGDLPDPQTPALPNGSEAIERRHDRTVRYDKPDTDRHQFRRKVWLYTHKVEVLIADHPIQDHRQSPET